MVGYASYWVLKRYILTMLHKWKCRLSDTICVSTIIHICKHIVYKYANFHNAYNITNLEFKLNSIVPHYHAVFKIFMTHYLLIFIGSNADQQVVYVYNKLRQCLCQGKGQSTLQVQQ